MLKVLVIDDDPIQCKLLINYLSDISDNVKIHSMAFSGEEALKIIKKNEINIILLDLKLPDISSIEIINYIEEKKLEMYHDSIIIISGETELISKINNSSYIYATLHKPINYEEVQTLINRIIEEKKIENCIRYKIKDELSKLYYNTSYNGTKYIYETIYQLYLRKNLDCYNLNKSIYPILADKYNTNVNNIHTNIKQATKSMYYDCPEDILKKYFNFDKVKKPKEKQVITTILNNIERSNFFDFIN